MASIVELRDMSDDKLEEMLENAREELFNLRFQVASARLEDYSRLKQVRRELAQLETVLNMRIKAETAAAEQPEIAKILADKAWRASTHFSYEDSGYQVEFIDEDGNELATALVDLNKKRPRGRRARAVKQQLNQVVSYEIAG